MKYGLQKIRSKEIKLSGAKKIILFGDPGCTKFTSESRRVVARILRTKADLFFVLGDIAYAGKPEEFEAFFSYCKGKTQSPIFTLCGNHDLPGYQKALGSSIYSIVLDDFVFVVLDNASGPLEIKNISFLKNQLATHKNKAFFILFHIPPPNDLQSQCMNQKEWFRLRKVLDKYKHKIKCLFTAHLHALRNYCLDGYRVVISGGGGANISFFKKSELNIHHALRLVLKNKRAFTIKVISLPNA